MHKIIPERIPIASDVKRPILEAVNLTKNYTVKHRLLGEQTFFPAVYDVGFRLLRGETLGVLGESGCGKTTLARMLAGLLPVSEGRILFEGKEIQNLTSRQFRPYRKKIQMIFQNPFDSLDPSKTIASSLLEPLRVWKIGNNKAEQMNQIRNALRECSLTEDILNRKPGEFSGGQLQRISIVRALLPHPEIIIADEIVSALDVPVQNQILELLDRLKEDYGLTVLFITHDLSVAQRISDRIMIMQKGRILKSGSVEDVLQSADHMYIQELMEARFSVSYSWTPSITMSGKKITAR